MNARTTQHRMRRMIPFLAVAFVVAVAATPKSAHANVEIYQKTLKSTCLIVRPMDQGAMIGSGVLVDKERRLVLTNYHVVGEKREVLILFPQYQDGKLINDPAYYSSHIKEIGLRCRAVAIDRKRDTAIVELPSVPNGVEAIEMASESVEGGDEVQSVGNPVDSGALWIYTSGTVRAVYKKTNYRTEVGPHEFVCMETQSPTNPGDSGGPIVNKEGKLVGITQSLSRTGRLISFNVDISELKAFLAEEWKPAPIAAAKLMAKVGLRFTKHQSGPLAVEIPIDGTKTMPIFLGNGTESYGKAEIRKIWSLVLQSKEALKPELVLTLLKQNSRTKMGAWTIEKNQQGEYLIMFCMHIDATSSADAVKSAMEYVSKVTLEMSKQLGATPTIVNNPQTPPQQASTEQPRNPAS